MIRYVDVVLLQNGALLYAGVSSIYLSPFLCNLGSCLSSIFAVCTYIVVLLTSSSAILQPESDTGTREHVIELSLPKISSIGHVEVKFALRPSATEIPDVKVALLCYKLENRNLGMVSVVIQQRPR